MSELTLLLLRFGFLILLWAFVFAIVYALRSDLFGERVRRMPEQKATPAPFSAMAPSPDASPRPEVSTPVAQGSPATSSTASRIVITSGPKEGMELPLTAEPLNIGRSSDSGLVIRDDYTSTHHAKLMLWGDEYVIQDLDSTNGTFLNGQRVTVPSPVPLNTPVKIGTTSFELRR